MTSIETQLAMARVIAALAEVMTPEQRQEAASKLRAMPGDDIERKFFANVAANLEQFAAGS